MLTHKEALSELKRGNERFVTGKSEFPNISAERRIKTTREGQKPFATVLTCSDSRTPPEYIFDRGLGDIFVVRVAGNICDDFALGSVELGVHHCGSSLVVVLGHRNCGVVSMAVKDSEVSEAAVGIIDKIKPAVESARRKNPGMSEDELIQESARGNALNAVEDILKGSRIIRERVRANEVKLVAAYYDIESGEVEWLSEGN